MHTHQQSRSTGVSDGGVPVLSRVSSFVASLLVRSTALGAVILSVFGVSAVEASDRLAPVGGFGFTAFREVDGSLEFVSVDAIGARRLGDRGFSVDETVFFSVDASPTLRAGNAPVLPPSSPTGVVVAVVDSGVDAAHPWFAEHLLAGRSFVGDPADWSDANGHGTHVAGIVRQGDPSARILPVRVFGSNGYSRDSVISDGIVWAVENGARVVNLSLGGPGPSAALDAAIGFARSRDVVVVASAGNSGLQGSPVMFPAANDLTFAVAAVDAGGSPAGFSNRGFYVDVAAPGVRVVSSMPGGGFAAMSGTSMAAPAASAAAARLRSVRPDVDAASVMSHLQVTSRDAGDPGRDDVYGWGVLDADRAVAEAANVSAPPVVESAGPLQVHTVSRVGAIVLRVGSPVSSLRVYAEGELVVDADGTAGRWVIPAIHETRLTVFANDVQGRPYQESQLVVSPLPVKDPEVRLVRQGSSLRVDVRLPRVEGRVRLMAVSADDDFLDVWVPRRGKATSVTYQFPSGRRLSWDVTVCLEFGALHLVCSETVTIR